MKRELRQRPLARNSNELFTTLEDIWMGIDVATFTASVHMMVQSVLNAYGWHIQYQFNHLIDVVVFFYVCHSAIPISNVENKQNVEIVNFYVIPFAK